MVVEIDYGAPGTVIQPSGDGGYLILKDPDTQSDYAAWPFHVAGEESNMAGPNTWVWKNPNDLIENITLSPSLKYEGGIGPNFHIHIRNGEIEHCGDCQCGCD